MPKKEDVEETEETPEETEEETEEEETEDDDADNWAKLSDLIDKRLEAWQGKQKTTSSSSPRKRAPATPKRKTGFLTRGFFDPPEK